MLPVWCRLWGLFLSTPSARRATFCGGSGGSGWPISIHALREEGDDAVQSRAISFSNNFYPRPPRGGRLAGAVLALTPLLISIHALREEGDPAVHQAEGLLPRFLSTPSARRATRWLCIRAMPSLDFYPRPPRGGRLHCWDNVQAANEFLSTPSARRATLPKNNGGKNHEFLSTPSARRATTDAYKESGTYLFLSTPSARRAT